MGKKLHRGQIVKIKGEKSTPYGVVVNPSTKSPLSQTPAVGIAPMRATMWVNEDDLEVTHDSWRVNRKT